MATLPRVTEPGITPNVDLVGAAGIGARAAANLGQAAARSAQQIGALVDAEIQEREEQYMAQAVLEADQLAIQGLEENDNPDAYNAWWEGVVEDQVSRAPTRMSGEIELMFRRRGQREELNLRREALATRRRETDLTRASAMDNIVEQIQTRMQNEGLEYMESPDYQADILQIQELAMLRAEADVTSLPENYVEQVTAEVEQTARLSAVGFAARAAFEQGRDLEQVRDVVQEQLSQEVMSDAERRLAMTHIMSPVEDLDRERRRAAEDALRARSREIDNWLSESARGNAPPPSGVRLLSSTDQGQAILDQIDSNLETYRIRQEFITSDAAGRAAMIQGTEDLYGVERDRAEAAIAQGQSYINSMRDNPAGFVLSTDEEFATRYQEAIQSQEPARVIEATTELLDSQRRAGWLERDVRVLSEDDAARMVDGFVLDPSDPNMRATLVAAVQNIDNMYGPHATRVFAELEDAGLPSAALYIANTQDTGAASLAARAATSTTQERRNLIQSADANSGSRDRSVLSELEAEVNRALDPVTSTLLPGNPNVASDVARARAQTMDLAMQAYIEGNNIRRSVEMATTAYTDRYQFAGTLRLPHSVTVHDVEYRIDRYMDNLSTDVITPAQDMSAYSDDEADFLRRSYVTQVRERGVWATRPQDDGVVLFDASGLPVIDAQTGTQVFIPWEAAPLSEAERRAQDQELRALGAIGP